MGSIARIISNTFYLTLDWIVLTLSGYVYWVLMSKMLPVGEIGKFSVLFNTSLFLVGISTMGMNAAVTRLFPEYQMKNDKKAISSAVLWTLKTTTITTIILGSVIFLLSSVFGYYGMFGSNDILLAIVVMTAANLVYMTTSYMMGLQRMKEIFISDSALSLLKLLVTMPLIILGFGYLGPVYGFIISAAAALILRIKWIPVGSGEPDKKRIWFYSTPVLVSSIGIMAVSQGSIVMLGFLSTPINAGLFSILFYITSPVKMIPQLISQGMFPTSSQKWASDDTKNIKELITRSVKYSAFIVLPLVIVLSIFSVNIIKLLTTDEYLPVSGLFVYMAVAYLFSGIASIFSNMLYSAGEVNAFRNLNLFGGFVNISAGFVLITRFGIAGAVMAFLLSTLAMMFASFYLLRRKIRFEIGGADMLKLVAGGLVFFAVSVFVTDIIDQQYAWIIGSFTGAITYAFALLFMRFFDSLDICVVEELEGRSSGRIKKLLGKTRTFLSGFAC
ncbi:MAG: polysaccharide biosynthesis C-terminal domain-containing protein [Candidatus Aenigmatarchaeota archaeon]